VAGFKREKQRSSTWKSLEIMRIWDKHRLKKMLFDSLVVITKLVQPMDKA